MAKVKHIPRFLGMTKLQIGILAITSASILCILGCGIILAFSSMFNTGATSIAPSPATPVPTPAAESSTPGPTATAHELPPHELTYAGTPFGVKDYWLLIIVDKNLPENQARILVDYYDRLYSDANTLIIDFHCDDLYATEAAVTNPKLKDTEYYSHVLYSYTHWRISSHKPGTQFSRAEELSSRSVCR